METFGGDFWRRLSYEWVARCDNKERYTILVGGQAEDKQAVLLSAEKSVWSGVSEKSIEREGKREGECLLTLQSVRAGGAFHIHRP